MVRIKNKKLSLVQNVGCLISFILLSFNMYGQNQELENLLIEEKKHNFIIVNSDFDEENPLSGWVQPNGNPVNSTATVRFADGNVAHYRFDGITWNFNFYNEWILDKLCLNSSNPPFIPEDPFKPTKEEVDNWVAANLSNKQKQNGTILGYFLEGNGHSCEKPDFIWFLNKGVAESTEIYGAVPFVTKGKDFATGGSDIGLNENIYHIGTVSIGTNTKDENSNAKLTLKTEDGSIGLKIKALEGSNSVEYINFDSQNIQNEGFPDFKLEGRRFDGVNGIDTSPNLVFKLGFNPGVTPPLGQVSLEDAWEYNFNLNNANPPDFVAERHWEFRPLPESGAPSQRWLSFAGRHNGTRTDFSYVADFIFNNGSNNVVYASTDHINSTRTVERYQKGVQFVANTNDITIENNLRLSGLGKLFNDDGNELNFGNLTNRNISTFYGSTSSNGDILRLKNDNSSLGWEIEINSFPSLQFTDSQTGNNVLNLFNGAPSNSINITESGNIGFGVGSPVHPMQHINGAHLNSAGVWINASDKSYKSNIKITKYGLMDVLKLNPVDYIHIKSQTAQTGFIAQDVKNIMPEFVSGEDGEMGINYAQMVAVLTKAIQEQQKMIEKLEQKIDELTNK